MAARGSTVTQVRRSGRLTSTTPLRLGPPSPPRAPQLDALRGVAACLVLIAHASRLSLPEDRRSTWTTVEASLGQAGVVLFFVLSGYLIGRMWVDSHHPTPRLAYYARRRVMRIWPAYALAYVATVVLIHPPDLGPPSQWALHLLLLHSWVPGEYVAVFPIGWTLGVEAMFYLVAPLLPRSSRRLVKLWVGSVVLAVIGGLIAPAVSDPSGWVGPLRYSLPPLFGLFCPGLIVAARPLWLERWRSQPLAVCATMVLFLVMAVVLGYQEPVWLRDLQYQAFAIAFGALLLLAIDRPGLAARPLRPLAALGTISYGLYLWHNTLMIVLLDAGVRAPWGSWSAGAAMLLVVTVPIAWLSWVVVERPAIRLAARTGRRQGGPAEQTAVGGQWTTKAEETV